MKNHQKQNRNKSMKKRDFFKRIMHAIDNLKAFEYIVHCTAIRYTPCPYTMDTGYPLCLCIQNIVSCLQFCSKKEV